MREYNENKVYDWLDNPFQVDRGSPIFNLPPMPIDDSFIPKNTDITLIRFQITYLLPLLKSRFVFSVIRMGVLIQKSI